MGPLALACSVDKATTAWPAATRAPWAAGVATTTPACGATSRSTPPAGVSTPLTDSLRAKPCVHANTRSASTSSTKNVATAVCHGLRVNTIAPWNL